MNLRTKKKKKKSRDSYLPDCYNGYLQLRAEKRK